MSAVGYALVEARARALRRRDAADALGVPIGPERGALQRGERGHARRAAARSRPTRSSGRPRPGRKVVYAGDTAPSQTVVDAARRADVLVHEATFAEEERERAARRSTRPRAHAAEVARDADVKLLALTHLSNRYFGRELARGSAGDFPETVVPRDFDIIEVPFRERGAPQLVKGGASYGRDAPVESSPRSERSRDR